MIVFLVLIGFSTLHSFKISLVGMRTEHQGLLIMVTYVILFSFAFRLISVQVVRLCQLIIGSSFFACLYSILQHYNLSFLPQDRFFTFKGRTFSFFDNPDYFGSFLVLVILLTITAYQLSKEKKMRGLYLFIFCIQCISLFESETRSAWIGTGIGFLIIILFTVWKRRNFLKNCVLIFMVLGLIFAFSSVATHKRNFYRAYTITNDIQIIIKNQNAGFAGASRWYIWQVSLPMIATHLWLGTGPNTFEQVFYSQNLKQNNKYLGQGKIFDENNDYLQIAFTMGAPVLVVYLLFLLIIMYRGYRSIKELDDRQQLFFLGLFAAIIGYLVQEFFNISVISVAPYYWLIFGFLAKSNKLVKLHTTVD